MVIDYETSQWSDMAIVDVLGSGNSTTCPNGYYELNGYFYGLESICRKGGSYELGSCPRRSTGVS